MNRGLQNQQHEVSVLVSYDHFTPAFRGGGPIKTLEALIRNAPPGFSTSVICSNHDLGETTALSPHPNEWVKVGDVPVRYVQGGIHQFIAALRSCEHPDIIYLNSLFSPCFTILPLALSQLGLFRKSTLLLAPRGQLDPGALALKSRKKSLFLAAFRFMHLHRRVLWHASAELEAENIRSTFGDVTILIRENETSLPKYSFSRSSRIGGPARLIFVSRLSEKKGLHTLLEALSTITLPYQLDIIGEFEDTEYKDRCLSLARSAQRREDIHFHGALPHDEVLRHLRNADLKVFPTAGENFGHVIAEALSQACPVMCSPTTPWTTLLQGGDGIIAPNTVKAWREAIEGFLSSSSTQWEAMSTEAGSRYNSWRSEDKGSHIFEQAFNAVIKKQR